MSELKLFLFTSDVYSIIYCSCYYGYVRNYLKSNTAKHQCVMMMTWVTHETRAGTEAIAYLWFVVFGALAGILLGWVWNSSKCQFTHTSGGW